MSRQDPLLSSSSRRDISSPSENVRANSIGCMSGIFRCIYKSHNRRRFLTSGKKQEKNAITSPPKESSLKNPTPAIPQEIRVSSSENLQNAPALVARLMGLSEISLPTSAESTVEEKRRRLLGALQKCDEDLKAIKKMIEVVKSVGDDVITSNKNSKIQVYCEKRAASETDFDELTRSAMCGYSKRYATTPIGGAPIQRKKKPGEEDMIDIRLYKGVAQAKKDYDNLAMPLWRSKDMIESLNEVCKDIAWGQRREIGRIALALQDFICKDLIDEVLKEMGSSFQLPLESCKRSLHF